MKLAVQKRTARGKALKTLRKEDQVPAIIYAKHMDAPIMVQCRRQDFVKLYKKGGKSTVLTLSGDGVKEDVLIHDFQIDPVTHFVLHIDFIGIKKGQEVHTEVPLVLTGTAPVAKSGDAKVQQVRDTLSITALPKDLPHDVTVDISVLKNTNDVLFVKDIIAPAGVTITDDPDVAVVTILEIKKDAEAADAADAAEAATEASAAGDMADTEPENTDG
jgi:large subunit ribosomal protein L25